MLKEVFGYGTTVPDVIFEQYLRANMTFPQMHGMNIIKTGRTVLDLVQAGQLSLNAYAQSTLSDSQVDILMQKTRRAHERAGIDLLYDKKDSIDLLEAAGVVTPMALRGVYIRSRNGVFQTLANFAQLTIEDALEDAPLNPRAERVYLANLPFSGQCAAQREALCDIWSTADDTLQGATVAAVAAQLHGDLRRLPHDPDERYVCKALAIRAARTALKATLEEALQPLTPEIAARLGYMRAEDAINDFPLATLYEGYEEFPDNHLTLILEKGLHVAKQELGPDG